MSRAQTMDVINDTTTMQSRIDTVLASVQPEYDWSPEIEWWPGDPLYPRPNVFQNVDNLQGVWIRPMFQVLDDLSVLEGMARCIPCDVYWRGDEPCFVCGAEDDHYKPLQPRVIFNNRFGELTSVVSDNVGVYATFSIDIDFEPFRQAAHRASERMEELQTTMWRTLAEASRFDVETFSRPTVQTDGDLFASMLEGINFRSREQPSVGWVGQHIHGIVYDESSAFTVEPYRPPLLNREPFNQPLILQDGWLDEMFRIPEVRPPDERGMFHRALWGEHIRIPRDRGKTPVPFPKGPIVIPNLPQHVRGDRHYLTSNVISQERRSRN